MNYGWRWCEASHLATCFLVGLCVLRSCYSSLPFGFMQYFSFHYLICFVFFCVSLVVLEITICILVWLQWDKCTSQHIHNFTAWEDLATVHFICPSYLRLCCYFMYFSLADVLKLTIDHIIIALNNPQSFTLLKYLYFLVLFICSCSCLLSSGIIFHESENCPLGFLAVWFCRVGEGHGDFSPVFVVQRFLYGGFLS